MIWTVIFAITVVALVAAVGSVVAAVLSRWGAAAALARYATLASAGVLVPAVVFIVAVIVAPDAVIRLLPDGAGEMRATLLSKRISEVMNSAVLSLPAVVIAGPVWLVAARRQRPER